MKAAILEMLKSKKFLAMITAIAVFAVGRIGLDIDASRLDPIWQMILVYVGAQGVADAGKSAALIKEGRS